MPSATPQIRDLALFGCRLFIAPNGRTTVIDSGGVEELFPTLAQAVHEVIRLHSPRPAPGAPLAEAVMLLHNNLVETANTLGGLLI